MANYSHLQFETYDTCSLKSNLYLIGTVLSTAFDVETHEPLHDCLIVAHSLVPEEVLTRFLVTGAPEKGYVFVQWADESEGRSLVSEQELHLISRNLNVGDTVKKNVDDAMVGTVLSVSETHTLQPICTRCTHGDVRVREPIYNRLRSLPLDGQCSSVCRHALAESVRHEAPHSLLYDVPAEELKKADDYVEGDYVLYRWLGEDWLGQVQQVVPELVIKLDNGTVCIPDTCDEVEIVVRDTGNAIVALPEPDGYKKPDIVSWNHGLNTMCPETLCRGQHVVTSKRNINRGRTLSGSPESCSTGIILEVRTRVMEVKWLVPDVRANVKENSRPPPTDLQPYENLGTFRNPRDIRYKKHLLLYDRGRQPVATDISPISSVMTIQTGDHLRFRDPTSASLKYKDEFGEHGHFHRMPRESTHGFDVNDLRVVYSRQVATVRWQDQTVSKHVSTEIFPYRAPDDELCPGEIVALKEETQQISYQNPLDTGTSYNEMQYLQGGYDLKLGKVGVVQAVDAVERVAKIRWFSHANVDLLQQGLVLKAGSTFGPISDNIEEVSIYEIMTHPALVRHRRELVLIPGAIEPSEDDLSQTSPAPQLDAPIGPIGAAALSMLRPFHRPSILEYVRGTLEPVKRNLLRPESSKAGEGNSSKSRDWVGEIVDLGLDGLITVRLGATTDCREIRIPLHWILMVIDTHIHDEMSETDMDIFNDFDEFMSDEDGSEAIEETVEYEGGERMDNDSDDGMWSTDEEDLTQQLVKELKRKREEVEDTAMTHEDMFREPASTLAKTGPTETEQKMKDTKLPQSTKSITTQVAGRLSLTTDPVEDSAHFDVLEDAPPNDHFAISRPIEMSNSTLRRIRKEHKILMSSLPSSIYVRTYETRLDLLRCLIFGPENTPYEYAPFVIDLAIPTNFPASPPRANFHSWTYGLGRVNPNLYEEGKICLSLLGTWQGRNEENWSEKATLLQILVSIQGLVLVRNPFFNEAGFESLEKQGEYKTEARLYSEKVFVMSRGFVKHALARGVAGFNDVLAWNYFPSTEISESSKDTVRPEMLSKVINRANGLISHAQQNEATFDAAGLVDGSGQPSREAFLTKLSRGAVVMLRKHIAALDDVLTEAKERKGKISDATPSLT